MKRAKFIFTILTITLLLTACGPKDTPEIAAKEWTQALLNLDGNKLAERTCTAQQANVQSAAIWASAFAVLGQQFTGQQAEADISDLRFETVSKSGNSAQVRAYGEIRTAVLAIAQTTQVDTTYIMVQEGENGNGVEKQGWHWKEQQCQPVFPLGSVTLYLQRLLSKLQQHKLLSNMQRGTQSNTVMQGTRPPATTELSPMLLSLWKFTGQMRDG